MLQISPRCPEVCMCLPGGEFPLDRIVQANLYKPCCKRPFSFHFRLPWNEYPSFLWINNTSVCSPRIKFSVATKDAFYTNESTVTQFPKPTTSLWQGTDIYELVAFWADYRPTRQLGLPQSPLNSQHRIFPPQRDVYPAWCSSDGHTLGQLSSGHLAVRRWSFGCFVASTPECLNLNPQKAENQLFFLNRLET